MVLYIFVLLLSCTSYFFFFFNDTATTEIYTLSLHDALPIYSFREPEAHDRFALTPRWSDLDQERDSRSEEHTSELQSRLHLVCRLLLEKKKKRTTISRLQSQEMHTVHHIGTSQRTYTSVHQT